MHCQIRMVWHVSFLFSSFSNMAEWQMEFRFCSLLHPLTVSAVITFRSLLGAQWQRDWVGHSLTLVSASCRLREEAEISPLNTPLCPDNPSIICYIACYLHDNLCLIFQPFNLERKGSAIEGIRLYGVFYFSTVVKFIFFLLPWAPNQSANWIQLNRRKHKSN